MTGTTKRMNLDNGWSFSVSSTPVHLDQKAVSAATDIVAQWAATFSSSETWVAKEFGVPSLFVRIDGVYHDGVWSVMEVEDRPCGMGVVGLFNPPFIEERDAIRTTWPSMHYVQSPNRITDDFLWLGTAVPLVESLLRTDHVLVRARPTDVDYHPLRTRSVSTVAEEGNKLALVHMRLATLVEWHDARGTPPNDGYIMPTIPPGPVVFKPVQGTRGRDVIFHDVDTTKGHAVSKKRGDTRGVDGIERAVKRHGTMIAQPLYKPVSLEHLPGLNVIYRLYFGFDTKERRYRPMHGAYVGSRSLKVHGDSESVFGPLIAA